MILTGDLKQAFKSYITARSGLYFKDHNLKDLEEAVTERMKTLKMSSFPAYYAYLTTSKEKEDEFRELLNILTIQHTYFFRNQPQFRVLRDVVLPEIIAHKSLRGRTAPEAISKIASSPSAPRNDTDRPSLRIWSAGCSTGEEPYTIAMVVADVLGDDLKNWDAQIIATDASEEALRAAQKGIYGPSSMRNVNEEHRGKYFDKIQNRRNTQYAIRNTIKKLVNFAYFNLMDEDYPAGFDVILCRNVVIYFELETTINVMNRFYSSLFEEGYLFIGYSETLQFIQDRFRMVSQSDALYYKKIPPGMPSERGMEEPTLPAEGKLDIERVLEGISRAEALAELEAKPKKEVPPERFEDILVQIIKAIHLKEYGKALRLIEDAGRADATSSDPHYLAAEIYINQGKPREAKKRLEKALELDSLFAPAHYLLGCISVEQNELGKAKENLKKALYINKDFLLAHFYLALVFKNEGSISNAIREYRNTVRLLSRQDPQDIIAYSGGFSAATLASVCRDNIERLKLEQV